MAEEAGGFGRIPCGMSGCKKRAAGKCEYCGLPIVSPDFLDLHRDRVFYYTPDTAESIVTAMKSAMAAGKDRTRGADVKDWKDVAAQVLEDAR